MSTYFIKAFFIFHTTFIVYTHVQTSISIFFILRRCCGIAPEGLRTERDNMLKKRVQQDSGHWASLFIYLSIYRSQQKHFGEYTNLFI